MEDFDYVKINSINPLYLSIDKVHGYIGEKNGNKYLTLVSTAKKKEVLIKYTKLWDKIKKINGGEVGEYGRGFIKIKVNSDDNL